MTKLKSKKMAKSTFAIIIMAIAMVALLAFGGTYAYFTATTTELASGEITTGAVKLTSAATFATTKTNIVPGADVVSSKVTVTPANQGTDSYVAVLFKVELKKAGEDDFTDATNDAALNVAEVLDDAWAPIGDGVYVYGTSETVLDEMTGTAAVDFTTGKIVFSVEDNSIDAGESEKGYMGATIKVTIRAAAIQSSDGQGGKIAPATAVQQLKNLLGATNYPDIHA